MAPDHRRRDQRDVRTHLLPARPAGTSGVGGHRLFLLAGGASPGGAGRARGRVLAGAGRRSDGDGLAHRNTRVLPAGRPGRGRPLQGVFRRGGRYGHGRGRRHGRGGAAVRRPP